MTYIKLKYLAIHTKYLSFSMKKKTKNAIFLKASEPMGNPHESSLAQTSTPVRMSGKVHNPLKRLRKMVLTSGALFIALKMMSHLLALAEVCFPCPPVYLILFVNLNDGATVAKHDRTLQALYNEKKNPEYESVSQLLDLEFAARRAFIDYDATCK